MKETKETTINLTQGDILPNLLRFAAPLLIGQLLQTLYNSVDSIVVGRFVGTNALAAVTASTTITQFFIGFFLGIATGASVIFAGNFGAEKYKDLKDSIHTAVTFAIILGLIVAILGAVFAPFILSLVSCPPEVLGSAIVYFRIYMAGALFMSLYNICSSVLRSEGDSRSPFIYLALSSCMNIILDILFVRQLKMGVAGVAVATVISQFTSVVLSFRKMMQSDARYRFSFRELKINGGLLKKIIYMGFPAGIQSSITSLSNIYLQRYINSFSSAAIAGIGSAMKIDQFAGMPCNALGLAMTTYVSQNMGAQKPERAERGVIIATVMMALMVSVIGTPVYFSAAQLLGIFSHDPEVITYGAGMLHIIMPVYIFMGFQQLFGGIIRGFGYSTETMVMAVGGMVVVRQAWLAVALHIDHNIKWIYYGYPIGWAVTAIAMLLFYIFVIRKNKIKRASN